MRPFLSLPADPDEDAKWPEYLERSKSFQNVQLEAFDKELAQHPRMHVGEDGKDRAAEMRRRLQQLTEAAPPTDTYHAPALIYYFD